MGTSRNISSSSGITIAFGSFGITDKMMSLFSLDLEALKGTGSNLRPFRRRYIKKIATPTAVPIKSNNTTTTAIIVPELDGAD